MMYIYIYNEYIVIYIYTQNGQLFLVHPCNPPAKMENPNVSMELNGFKWINLMRTSTRNHGCYPKIP